MTDPFKDLGAELEMRRKFAMDAETKHDPSNGQFTSGGSSGSGFSHEQKKKTAYELGKFNAEVKAGKHPHIKYSGEETKSPFNDPDLDAEFYRGHKEHS